MSDPGKYEKLPKKHFVGLVYTLDSKNLASKAYKRKLQANLTYEFRCK